MAVISFPVKMISVDMFSLISYIITNHTSLLVVDKHHLSLVVGCLDLRNNKLGYTSTVSFSLRPSLGYLDVLLSLLELPEANGRVVELRVG